jgi:hypothetical protein
VTASAALDSSFRLRVLGLTVGLVIGTVLWVTHGKHESASRPQRWVWRHRWLLLVAAALLGFFFASALGYTA